ncbi:MAG: hypothetical protein PUE65_07980 [Mollicutes bacterium]|nr:hypothetical protein [Mollicutes bacterium]
MDKGVELYKKVIANDDDNVLVGKAYRNLGIIRYRLQENKDEEEAYLYFEKGASLNDPYCLFRIALAYKDGEYGFKQNVKKSLELFKNIELLDYETNKTVISYGYLYKSLGDLYSFPKYGIEDCKTAMEYYQKGASMNDASCLHVVGTAFSYGEHGYEKNPQKAVEFFQKALESSGEDTTRMGAVYGDLGDVYMDDFCNPTSALNYYEKGAVLGDFHCLCNLARAYGEGVGYKQDPLKALELYKKAEKDVCLYRETPDGLNFYWQFGDLYRDSLNDFTSAYMCYEKGASLNSPACLIRLAVAYAYGAHGYNYNFEKSEKIFLKAIESKYATSELKGMVYSLLGVGYFLKRGSKHVEKALRYFEEGEKMGDISCTLWRVRIYLAKTEGDLTKEDASRLIDVCQKILKKNNLSDDWTVVEGDVYDELAHIYLRCPSLDRGGEIFKSILFKGVKVNASDCLLYLFELKKKQKSGNEGELLRMLDACYKSNNINIYLFLIYLIDPVFYNPSKAKAILENMEKTEVFAWYEYYAGIFSLIAEKDYQKATNWFLKSLKKGRDNAATAPCLYLGEIYQSEDNENKNYELAFTYFLEGAKANNALCAFEVAKCYQAGKGVEQDFDKAIRFFLKANRLGRPCLYDVATIYGDKSYSGFNAVKQISYYEKGSDNNEKKCIEKLIECYKLGIGVKKNPYKLNRLIVKLENTHNELDYDIVSDVDVVRKHKMYVQEGYTSFSNNFFRLMENYVNKQRECFENLKEVKNKLNAIDANVVSTKSIVETIDSKIDGLIDITKTLKEDYSSKFQGNENADELVYGEVTDKISDAAIKQQTANADDLDGEIKKRIGPSNFDKLEGKSLKFLRMGLRLYKEFKDKNDDKLDYSCINVLLCKAVENELKRRCYEKYLEYLKNEFGEKYDEYPKILTVYKNGKIFLDKSANFTLGSIKKILGAYIPDHRVDVGQDTAMRDKKLLNRYLASAFTLDASVNVEPATTQLIEGIRTIVDKYRNPSCHPVEISLALASECYEFILGGQNGFLKKALDLFKA